MILPKEALEFAIEAHGTQLRKYTLEPYVTHSISVALILQQHYPSASHTMITAALLHDVVEDTPRTIQDIEYHFGNKVARMVRGLTDVSEPQDGNRKVRKQVDCEHISKQDAPVQLIKCADLIHNTTSIVAHSPLFARVYIPEALATLKAMKPEVRDTYIWGFAINQVTPHLENLKELI